jgi:hypothetical protein
MSRDQVENSEKAFFALLITQIPKKTINQIYRYFHWILHQRNRFVIRVIRDFPALLEISKVMGHIIGQVLFPQNSPFPVFHRGKDMRQESQ